MRRNNFYSVIRFFELMAMIGAAAFFAFIIGMALFNAQK